jgi:hypothetical protein
VLDVVRMSVLVITMNGDVHAHAVAWALREMGVECRRWIPTDLASAPATVRLSSAVAPRTLLNGPDGEIYASRIDHVWLRRLHPPEPSPDMTAGDAIVARRQAEAFVRGMLCAFRNATWSNAPAAQRLAGLKLPQLVAARGAGLHIPDTVMTNDMDVVRDFVDAHERVIYKGFLPQVWWDGGASQVSLATTPVDRHDLDDDESLRLCPGIFQEHVAKAYEVRAFVFGTTCIAAKISDQDPLDWKLTYDMRLEPHVLPRDVEAKLFATMNALGLAMGTIDLIVTPDGEHVFLEINEQGQFLWVEVMNPDIRVLEPFARYLAGRREPAPGVDFAAFRDSAAARTFDREAFEAPGNLTPIVVPDGNNKLEMTR